MRSASAKAFLELRTKFEQTMRRFEETEDLAERERLLQVLNGIVKQTNTTLRSLEAENAVKSAVISIQRRTPRQ